MGIEALDGWVFATIFMFSFALFLLITGAFTAYFGSGKSRKIGAGLLVGGLLIGIIWGMLRYMGTIGPAGTSGWLGTVIIQTIVIVLAVVIGAGLAIGLFLLAIMKS
jgi:hypothetical protein